MPRTIQVQPGETLSGIAQRELGSASRYNELGYTGDPRKLQIGTTLTIPDQSQAKPVYQPPSTPEQSTMERIAALQQNVKELSDLKAKAQVAGLGQDEQIPDYLKATKLEDVPRVVESGRVKSKIAELEKAGFAGPAKSYQDIYNQAFEQTGLGAVKQQISALDEKMRKVKEALFAKESEIAEDPWSSAGTKLKLTEKEYKKAQKDLELLLDERKQYTDQYNQGISMAERTAEQTLGLEEKGRERALTELKYLKGLQEEVAQEATEEKDAIRELRLKYPTAGILEDDTIDEAIDKATKISPAIEEDIKWSGGQPYRAVKDSTGKVLIYEKVAGVVEKAGGVGGGKPLGATQFNIKAGILGLLPSQVEDIVNLTKPPQWFADKMKQEIGAPLLPGLLQGYWQKAKDKVNQTGQSSESGITNPYE